MMVLAVLLGATLTSASPKPAAAQPAPLPAYATIFNGRDLAGWKGATTNGYWKVAPDGTLECVGKRGWGDKKTIRNIWTARTYTNFVLRFEYKLTPKCNNGVGIRAPEGNYITSSGMEIQILEDESTDYFQNVRKLAAYQYNASLYGTLPAKRQSAAKGYLKPVGEWNEEEIRAEDTRLTVRLNGETVIDADLAALAAKDRKEHGGKAKHPGLARPAGHVNLCWHNDTMWFRNMRIKDL